MRPAFAALAALAVSVLFAAQAEASILDIFRKSDASAEPAGPTIFGMDLAAVALVALTVVLLAVLLYYRPRVVFRFLAEMVGELVAWLVVAAVTVALVAAYLVFVDGVALVVALVIAVVAVVVVMFGS